MTKKLTVGQSLWLVPQDRRHGREPCEVTVTKVGRKWATIEYNQFSARVDVKTLWVDGSWYDDARCYLSRELWDEHKAASQAWREFRATVEYVYEAPLHLSAAEIMAIHRRFKGERIA